MSKSDFPNNSKVEFILEANYNTDVLVMKGSSIHNISEEVVASANDPIYISSDEVAMVIIKPFGADPFVQFSYQN